jgi:hypothetical protein
MWMELGNRKDVNTNKEITNEVVVVVVVGNFLVSPACIPKREAGCMYVGCLPVPYLLLPTGLGFEFTMYQLFGLEGRRELGT